MIFCGMNCKNMAKVWKIPDIFLYLHCLKIGVMRTVQDYIAIIRQNSSKITKDFGIKTLRIFGSVSRNEQTECSVDVVRIHKNMNPFFKSRIERDGIYAIS